MKDKTMLESIDICGQGISASQNKNISSESPTSPYKICIIQTDIPYPLKNRLSP